MCKLYLLSVLLLLGINLVWVQFVNDECVNVIELIDFNNWCLVQDVFMMINVIVLFEDNFFCFFNNQNVFDVWFIFIVVVMELSIMVVGEIDFNDGGMIQDFQFVLYEGSCDFFGDFIVCGFDNVNVDEIMVIQLGLVIGEIYFLWVSVCFN